MRGARRCSRLNIAPALLHNSYSLRDLFKPLANLLQTKAEREERRANRDKNTSDSDAIEECIHSPDEGEKTSGDAVGLRLFDCGQPCGQPCG